MKFFFTTKEMGIDLGTSNTMIYIKGKGVLLREPSVVAVDTGNQKVLAVGLEARKMIGRTPAGIETFKPLKDGVITNFDVTQQMLKLFIEKAAGKGAFTSSKKIVVSHPSGVSEIEKRVVSDITKQPGDHKVLLIEDPVAAAIGAGIPVDEPAGSMIIDIGGGTTDIAVISLGGIVTSQTLKVAGDKMDHAIINYVRKNYKLSIGERTAEDIKIELGSAFKSEGEEERKMEIKGRDLRSGLPRLITITESEIREALQYLLELIVDAVKTTLEETEPELASDIMYKGITITGGGGLLKGFDKLIFNELNIPARVAESPLECVVLGAGKCLEMFDRITDK